MSKTITLRAGAPTLALASLLAGPLTAAETAPVSDVAGPARAIAAELSEAGMRVLVGEVLERNPALAVAEARARAARLEAPQAKSLPDPMLGATAYVQPPETRVGPQKVMASLSQRFPWFGKLSLREEAALRRADALDAQVEAQRLELVTETRRLYYEIAFLDELESVVKADRETLAHYEELARARYASGVGLEQGVIKIQAEITKDDNRLLDIGNRRATLAAALNALRDEPQETALPRLPLPGYPQVEADAASLRARALTLRPELAAADAEVARADRLIDLARKEYKPDVTIGALYTWVGDRSDPAGIAQPPPDNGQNVFGISASLNLPIRRGRLKAGVEQAAESRLAAVEAKRGVTTMIDRSLGELVERVRLTWQQVELFDRVLGIQAEQSLRSAEAGYSAGTLNSLDLLDAERVLLDVRTATERARADYAIALARLEGAVGERLTQAEPQE